MNLLAIETATEACSVALGHGDRIHLRHEIAPRGHAQRVLPWIDALLAEAGLAKSELDAIAVGRGPGAFTGVRLAVALVQGLALALDRPVLPVSTLATLAQPMVGGLAPGETVLASIDARMGEVYLGVFARDEAGIARAVVPEAVVAPALAVLPEGIVAAVGTGLAACDGVLAGRLGGGVRHVDPTALPSAADALVLARGLFVSGAAIRADALEPAYLRDKVALTLDEQRASKGLG